METIFTAFLLRGIALGDHSISCRVLMFESRWGSDSNVEETGDGSGLAKDGSWWSESGDGTGRRRRSSSVDRWRGRQRRADELR